MDNSASQKLSENEFFSERLSQAMTLSGLSGKDVASAAGIDAGYLSNLKKGKRSAPSSPVIKALATALGVREAWLSTGEPPISDGSRGRLPGVSYESYEARSHGDNSDDGAETIRDEPLDVIDKIRAEVIRSIQSGAPPSSWLLALIGEIEAIVVEMRSKKER